MQVGLKKLVAEVSTILTIYVPSKISVSDMAFATNFMESCKKRISIHGYGGS